MTNNLNTPIHRMMDMGKYLWKLPEYLKQKDLTAYRIATTVPRGKENTVYRLAREGDRPTSVNFEVLGMIVDALEQVTGEKPKLDDLLEYVADDPNG